MTTASPSTSRSNELGSASRQPADVFVVVRDHRRPREGDDVPLALPARAARPARLPDRGRRGRRLDGRPAQRARPRVDRRNRRAARREGLRPLRRPALLRAGRLRRRGDVRARGARRSTGREQPGLLPRDPAVPLRHGRQGPGRGRPDAERARRRREAVRTRPGLGPRARRRAAPVHRRVAALPDRPLPREDGPRGDPLPAVREHDARAGLEPELRRVRPDHDGGGLRRRGPRPLLRPGRRAARRRRQPPHAGRRGGGDGGALGRRPEDDQGRAGRALPRDRGRPTRPTTCAASTTATSTSTASRRTRPPRPTPRCASRSRTGAGPAFRSSSARASGCR